MATVSMNYASKVTLTWGMTSPSSDTNLLAGRESLAISNASNLYMDLAVGGMFKLHASTAAVGVIEVWAYGSVDEATTYTSDVTGSDANLTLVAQTKSLLRLVTVIPTPATNGEELRWGPIYLAQVFGGALPRHLGLWGVHDSGGALATSTTVYHGIKFDSA